MFRPWQSVHSHMTCGMDISYEPHYPSRFSGGDLVIYKFMWSMASFSSSNHYSSVRLFHNKVEFTVDLKVH